MLSVSGARGIVGESMTPDVAARFAAAFAQYTLDQAHVDEPLVCIGRDSRPSGEVLIRAARRGLESRGCRVVDLGIVATPTVGVMIDHRKAHGGIVITASHNPDQWNGLKALDSSGAAPSADDARRIIELFHASSAASVQPANLTAYERDESANEVHIERILSAVDVKAIQAGRLKVVLDSVNGAGCIAGRRLLEALGCTVVHLNGEPSGAFAHPPEPLEANLTDLAQRSRAESAVCGFAQDPDADRLAVVDEAGHYIGEEYTLVLAAMQVLRTCGPGAIAANLSTSRMIDDIAASIEGASVVRSAVGEANVVAKMRETEAVVGGEGNGGVIWPRICWVRDSLSSMALVLQLLVTQGRPLSAIVDSMPRYAMVKEKYELHGRRFDIDEATARLRGRFENCRINTMDGVRIDLDSPDRAWLHLRPSNTEPIVRIIAEASTETAARELIAQARPAIG